jgi:hypothetical protein
MSYTEGLTTRASINQDFGIIADGKYVVGEAYRQTDWDREEDAEANARLWAAAPELLVLLTRWAAINWDILIESAGGVPSLDFDKLEEETQAVIAKARGQ